MKKMFTLLFVSVVTVSIASAQSGRFDYGKPDMAYNINGKPAAIRKINHEYDYKIAAVSASRRMSRFEKSRQIRQLEKQRDAEIALVKYRFDKNSRFYGDDKYSRNNSHKW